jgi:hypothetical protein
VSLTCALLKWASEIAGDSAGARSTPSGRTHTQLGLVALNQRVTFDNTRRHLWLA